MKKEIHTSRLSIRCYRLEDAPLLKDAVDTSLDHLREFLERAYSEPETLEKKETRIENFIEEFENGKNYVFGIFDSSNSLLIGVIGVHKRIGPRGVEFGYWIRKSHAGQGYGTEAVSSLIPVVFQYLDVEYIEIHTRTDNLASQRIPEKLGFEKNEKLIAASTGDRYVRVMKRKDM